MKKNFFAFFLKDTGYIEKCLLLIKYVGNPNSKTVPHVTLRLAKENQAKLEDLRNVEITYVNITKPGIYSYNEKANRQYAVHLKCDSEELEEFDYRPDYPYSDLHITLYDGNDRKYARWLYSELKKLNWYIKLSFPIPQRIQEQALGSHSEIVPNYVKLGQEVLGDSTISELISDEAEYNPYLLAEKILCKLKHYFDTAVKLERVLPQNGLKARYIDESKKTRVINIESDTYSSRPYYLIPALDDGDERKFYTPPEYANDMILCALDELDQQKHIDFGDPALGTGRLYLSLLRRISEYNNRVDEEQQIHIDSAIGIELDKKSAKQAHKRFGYRGLEVICGDSISANLNLGRQRNLMVVNPPYNCSEELNKEYRKQIALFAKEQTGIKVPAKSSLHVYHMLIMDKWLANDGIGVWLIPSTFLQVGYGAALRQYLTNNVQLLRIHMFDEKSTQFDKTLVSTAIVVFKKCSPRTDATVKVTYGNYLNSPSSANI